MSLLRELADLMIEAAKYLDGGNQWDKAWAKHLRSDALDVGQLAQVDRHAHAERSQSKP